MVSIVNGEEMKGKCQVFTPSTVVEEMLNHLGYCENIYGKKILENSCGDGQFLTKIVIRYINACKKSSLSDEDIRRGLSADIYGIELDKTHYDNCIKELNTIVESNHIGEVEWQIHNRDALKSPIDEEFDFIIGNPPYISYWDMSKSERSFIKENYSVCDSGACDYSYAFTQECFSRLSNTGRFVYLVPNSLFKTKSGQKLRKLLLSNITTIYDYTTTQLFKGVLTTPAIIVVDKGAKPDKIIYKDVSANTICVLKKTTLGDAWVFDRNVNSQRSRYKRRFGDYFNVSLSIATQRNSAFILSNWENKDGFLCHDSMKVELGAVRSAASPKGKKQNRCEHIIFPYMSTNNTIDQYIEEEYKALFPNTYGYLLSFKDDLEMRDSDKSAQWFEYGRSQALRNIWKKKLLLSTLITGVVYVYELDEEEVPYSGLYITLRDDNEKMSLDDAKKVLQSEGFLEYVKAVGISASGKSIRIKPDNICDYRF